MATRIRYSPDAVAALLVMNAELYGHEKGREVSRFRISRVSLRRISGRSRLKAAFLDDLTESMFDLGWHFIEHNDTEYAGIQVSKMSTWPKLAHKRLIANGLLGANEADIFTAYDSDHPDDGAAEEEAE